MFSAFLGCGQGNAFRISFCVYTEQSSSSFFYHFYVSFFLSSPYRMGIFGTFGEWKWREKWRGYFFYIGIKKQWQQFWLNPVFMLVSRCLGVWCIHTAIVFLTIFLIVWKDSPLLFFGCFSFKALWIGSFWVFGRIKDMRNMWERKRRIEGSRIFQRRKLLIFWWKCVRMKVTGFSVFSLIFCWCRWIVSKKYFL